MSLFVIFVATTGLVYGKAQGEYALLYAGVALVLAGFTSVISYYNSDKIILSLSSAKQIAKQDQPEFYRIVENLCIGSGLPLPKIFVIQDSSPNAFATGRDPKHSSICVTTGLLQQLNKIELEGVIAHELSHITNFDIRLMTITAIFVGFIAIIGDVFLRSLRYGGRSKKAAGIFILIGIIFAILSPIAASLIQLAISRKREFLADASGALLTRYPEGLASALEKISASPLPVQNATNATAHLFIDNPFKNKQSGQSAHWFASLFNTHPPAAERIRILRSM
ncbi:MAG: M48 family metallopeptidase [Candidatus Levybacteria bacterium]|nr:M48 family metallopeptidase [Candidatus Levybacteria bacterium]